MKSANIDAIGILSTLNKHKTNKLVKAFPYTKNEILKRVYRVELDGKLNDLILDINKKHKSEISEIKRIPKTEKIQVYDPSDYMWTSHKDDWLWHLVKINASKAWDITKGSWDTKIAILDSWFDINHPDLMNKISPHYDPYDLASYTTDCTENNHGTAVASFAAGETDGGGQLASIGFNCRIIAYQAHDGNYLERAHHASLAMNADVVTSSAGGWRCNNTLDDMERIAVKEILDNGTIIVMPAGNGVKIVNDTDTTVSTRCRPTGSAIDRPWFPLSPLYDERIIIVSSTDKNDNHIFKVDDTTKRIHSFYPEVDVCAPGYCLMGASCTEVDTCSSSTCCVTSGWPYYGCGTGTSFATPIVAGVCALMKTINPNITPAEVQEIIKKNG
ncbi:MAG: S8/S53 family peptidase [Bacteroidales bacterium]|nr:S8/S53 family peptidase [Bacteroidales bacterium]